MAGGFGGDDDQYSVNDPEEQEDGEDEGLDGSEDMTENEDAGLDEDDEDDEDEPDDGASQKEKENYFKEKIKKLTEARLKPKFVLLTQKLKASQRPVLTPFEIKDLKKAKDLKILKKERLEVYAALAVNQAKTTSQVISGISPALPYIGIGLAVVVAAIAIIAAIVAAVQWLFPGFFDGIPGVDPDKIASDSNVAMQYEDFYGLRTIYYNENQARAEIILDFDDVINDTANSAFNEVVRDGSATITIDSKEYIFTGLVLNTDIKDANSEDFDFTRFASEDVEVVAQAEDDLKSLDENRYNAIKALAVWTLNVDQGKDYNADFDQQTTRSLVEIVDDITRFGLGSTADLKTLVSEYIARHYTFEKVCIDTMERQPLDFTENELTEMSNALFEEVVETKVETVSTDRTEKLFIKDHIVTENNNMSAIDKQDYVVAMFMPKKTIMYEHIYIIVVNPEEDFSSTLSYDSGNVNLKRDDQSYRIDDRPESTDDTRILFMKTDDNMGLNTTAFDLIGRDVEYLKDGKSLLGILRDGKADDYLSEAEDVYTYNESGLIWTPTNELDGERIPFVFVVNEIKLSQ